MRLLLNILAFVVCIPVIAQNVNTEKIKQCVLDNNEKVEIQLNKQIYVCGEDLYFSTNTISANKNISRITYFEIRNVDNILVHNWRALAEEGSAYGKTTLPDTLSPGFFTLIGYTNFQRNFKSEYLSKIPLIITSINNESFRAISISSSDYVSKESVNSSRIHLIGLKDKVTGGKEMSISLETSPQLDDFSALVSVSVNEVTPFDSILSLLYFSLNNDILPEKAIIARSDSFFIRESNLYSVSGRLTDTSNMPMANTKLVASYTGSSLNFRFAKTDSDGRFRFFFDKRFNDKVVVFQIFGKNLKPHQVNWKIDQKNTSFQFPKHFASAKLNTDQDSYLHKIRKAELVKRIYLPSEGKVRLSENISESFFPEPDYIVRPAEYEALNDFEEIAANLLPGVRFTKDGGAYSLSILNNKTQKIFTQNQLVFLNGQVFQNLKFLQTLNSEDIDRIEVYNKQFMYGGFNLKGILSIYTKDVGVEPSAYRQPYYLFNNAAGTTVSNINDDNVVNKPMVNPHVYWNPQVQIKAGQKSEISFKTPKLSGIYCIKIQGVTKDGKPLSIIEKFEVE